MPKYIEKCQCKKSNCKRFPQMRSAFLTSLLSPNNHSHIGRALLVKINFVKYNCYTILPYSRSHATPILTTPEKNRLRAIDNALRAIDNASVHPDRNRFQYLIYGRRSFPTAPLNTISEVGNADRMNQRRVRVLPRSESRRGAYAAKPRQRR